jgi:DNA polymerase-3 subunit beta
LNMDVTIERGALLKALGHVQSVVERRNTIPILSNVLIDASAGGVSLTATDMDLTIVESIACMVMGEGSATAPAHTFYDIVRKLPDGSQVALSTDSETGHLSIQAGRAHFNLPTLPKQDFPAPGDEELPTNFDLPSADFRGLIDKTRFAISTEETRYYLNGIYIHPKTDSENGQVLRAVATDGHRLARVEIPMPDGAASMPGVIVPRKAVAEVRKLLDNAGDESISISLSESKVRFAIGGVVLTSKLIDGTFPDYERVIPVSNDKELDIDCAVFSEAVDRVSTISSEKSRAVKMSAQDGRIILSANSPDHGMASEELEVEYQHDAIDIGFNARYLLDIAQQIDGNQARFLMSDGASPTVILDLSDGSALYVLMPMRV